MSAAGPTTPLSPRRRAESRVGTWAGFAIIVVLTTVAALVEMTAAGQLGWLTGVVFCLASAFVALTIRRSDLSTAIISPPLAFLAAVIISAQPAVVGSSGNFWLLEATTVLTGLAFNAQWVFLGTGIALVIALARRHRARRNHTPEHVAPVDA